ncbi:MULTISPECIES: two-component system sensor histidine kinase PmrB [Pseudocitrobacter]|uniref:histidine kinase n=1 Tax=Pseudocitrobacter vendiensis TaxID=2488306 RepID=A0ABM9F3V7_9ENTR|nr:MULTISPECIES: two-component system sensor histidine kinase PmrB [Pseudocitrobacter]KAA1047213.1 two-component system sensor histidine kinase PmrB [Pseudocitrobacter sp. 73]CAH6635430.1 Histidine kinase [Pseudocitrobacter vendiensis]
MPLSAIRKWPMRHQLLLTVGLILVVFQVISVFWLWHESKEQIDLEVASILKGHNNAKHIQHEVREAVASLLVPSLVIIGLALFVCMKAVKRITRPLSDLQKELDARTPDNLQPIHLEKTVLEVDAVTSAINQLVARLTQTLDRERLFTADVAHELRTPLAGLRLHLELIEKTQAINVGPLIQRLDQMTNSVAQLLQLARVGQSFSAGSYQRVELMADVILPLRDELESMLKGREQTLVIRENVQDIAVAGDATLIKVMVRNLVENAYRYSPTHSTITLSAAASPTPMLIVEDEGPGIDESKVGELSQAFVRMDSRYGGIGLGLSIVTRIAQLHEAAFYLQNREERSGTRAWIAFTPANLKSTLKSQNPVAEKTDDNQAGK